MAEKEIIGTIGTKNGALDINKALPCVTSEGVMTRPNIQQFIPETSTGVSEKMDFTSSTVLGGSNEFSTIAIPQFAPSCNGDGQIFSFPKQLKKETKKTIISIIESFSKLDRELKNPEHREAYHNLVADAIRGILQLDTSVFNIFAFDWVLGMGKTSIGVRLATIKAMIDGSQLVIVVPNTQLSKEQSIAHFIGEDILKDTVSIANIALGERVDFRQHYQVIITTLTHHNTECVKRLIRGPTIVFADEVDVYVNDTFAVLEEISNLQSPQSLTKIVELYGEIEKDVAWFKAICVPKMEAINKLKPFAEYASVSVSSTTTAALKEQAKKRLISLVTEDVVRKTLGNYKALGKSAGNFITDLKVLEDEFSPETMLGRKINNIKNRILHVLKNLTFYRELVEPSEEEFQRTKKIRGSYPELEYSLDVNVIKSCIEYVKTARLFIDNGGNDIKLNSNPPKLSLTLPSFHNNLLDVFFSLKQEVSAKVMIIASATLCIEGRGWYSPLSLLQRYFPNTSINVSSFKKIVSPTLVDFINFASEEAVHRIVGVKNKQADIWTAKANVVIEQILQLLEPGDRLLIQGKRASVSKKGEASDSQMGYIATALRLAGITYTDDPAHFNDERFQVILSTVDEAERLRGLNFRVTFVVLCEMGNVSNARNLLQAIRAGRMCYNIEKVMRVFIMWRGFQYIKGTEKQACENVRSILEETGYDTRDIYLTHASPRADDRKIDFIEVPNRLLHGQSNAPWSCNIFTKEHYIPFVRKTVTQEYKNMINTTNRPAVCACNRQQCSYLHVRNVLGMLSNVFNVSKDRINYILRELENYPRFIPLECRLRPGFQPCREYSLGNFKTTTCDNVSTCRKQHYYEIVQEDAFGKSIKSYLPYQNVFGQVRTPLHLHCSRALREQCYSSEGRACNIPIIPGTKHDHDCNLPHCEIVRQQPQVKHVEPVSTRLPTLTAPRENPWQTSAATAASNPWHTTRTASAKPAAATPAAAMSTTPVVRKQTCKNGNKCYYFKKGTCNFAH